MNRPLIPILGGTFDPIHHGHLRCAWEVAEWTGEPVRMMPAGRPGHRNRPDASPEHRWEMLKLAVAGEDRLIACDREIRDEGATYSVNTLRRWRQDRPQAAFCLIVGQDAFADIQTWKDWRSLFELTHFIVVRRPGQAREWPQSLRDMVAAREVRKADDLRREASGRVAFRDITALDISATGIRRMIAGGRDPAFLIPETVRRYIRDHGLYRDGDD